MGYPPLATPTSQLVGTQAVFNVIAGERWKIVSKEVRDYFLGLYGTPPGPVDEEIRRKITKGAEPITCRPGKLVPPELKDARRKIDHWFPRSEDVLSYVLFPAIAEKHLEKKYSRFAKRDTGLEESVDGTAYPV
jgi:oxaloacetate decarboxylase alpha subunit